MLGAGEGGREKVPRPLQAVNFNINLSDYFGPCGHAESFYRCLDSSADSLPCGNCNVRTLSQSPRPYDLSEAGFFLADRPVGSNFNG
jgi:hypothetical protein